MDLELHLKIVGALFLLLSVAHLFFPKQFGWKEDLAKLTLLNRQIFRVHDFFIDLVLIFCGVLSLAYANTLLQRGELAKLVLIALTIFWSARWFIQFFYYDPKLWRGNRFNTGAHIFFGAMWTYTVAIYATTLYRQYRG